MDRRIVLFIIGIVVSALSISIGQNMKSGSKEKTIYLINRSKYGYEYSQFAKGSSSAAVEYGINLQILAPDYEQDVSTQKLLLKEAAENKPLGIIIFPIDPLQIIDELRMVEDANTQLLIVSNNTGVSGTFDYLGPEHYEIGKAIAESINNDKIRINVYASKDLNLGSRSVLKGLEDSLGKEVKLKKYLNNSSESQVYVSSIKSHVEEEPFDIAIALDEYALEGLAASKELIPDTKIIGLNMSPNIVNYIDREVIEEVYITSPFSLGYLAVTSMIGKIENEEKVSTKFIKVNKENLFDKYIEKIIFTLD